MRQIELHHLAAKDAEPFVAASFGAGFEEQLQSEANPERRLLRINRFADRVDEPAARSSVMASGNAPTPGSTTFEARRTTAGSLEISAAWPTFSNPFCTLRRFPIP